MNRCPITYETIKSGRYSRKGLNRLNPQLNSLKPIPHSEFKLILLSQKRTAKMSIQGVQPKLGARLSVKNKCFEFVDRHGIFILKPNAPKRNEIPANEDLTMRLASMSGIDVPFHGLVYNKEEKPVYFIRRFDRYGKSGKVHVEDFAQVAGMNRKNMYGYPMENVAATIETYCTFPIVEKMKLFRRTLFSYLVGNEHMHLKNLSLIHRDGKVELSPAYDLLNSTIVLSKTIKELALPLKGKKINFTHHDIFTYFGEEILGLNQKILSSVEEEYRGTYERWLALIDISFLSDEMKEKYIVVLDRRRKSIGWE